jgi:hypothetical protein
MTKAFVFVMPMFSAGDEKRPEAAILRVIKTFVERLCCIGEFETLRIRRLENGLELPAKRRIRRGPRRHLERLNSGDESLVRRGVGPSSKL